MDVVQIAESRAELLHRLSNWRSYSTFDGESDPRTFTGKLDAEEMKDVRLVAMTAELAASRARAANRDFGAVLMEVELEVAVHLARILAGPVRPARPVEDEGHPICGICQEEMEREEEGIRTLRLRCNHEFHGACIVEWLQRKMTCPFCRYQLQDPEFYQFLESKF